MDASGGLTLLAKGSEITEEDAEDPEEELQWNQDLQAAVQNAFDDLDADTTLEEAGGSDPAWSDREDAPPSASVTQGDLLSAETQEDQLRLLYEARGRELDRLTEEAASLQRRLVLLKAERETALAGESQAKVLLTEYEGRLRGLTEDLGEKGARVEGLEAENRQLRARLAAAEGTVASLEQQVAQLQSVNYIAKNRRSHEEFLKKLQGAHGLEVEDLRQKLRAATGRAEQLEDELRAREDDLATVRRAKDVALREKAETIRRLNASLDAAHQHIEALLSRKAEGAKGPCACEGQLQREVETFDALAKLGLFGAVLPPSESSADQLRLGKALTFDDDAGSASVGSPPQQEPGIDQCLRRELLQSLVTNKTYREQVARLKEEVGALRGGQDQQVFLLLEENRSLKRELATLAQEFEAVRGRGEALVEAAGEGLGEAYAKAVERCGLVCSQAWQDLRRQNAELLSGGLCEALKATGEGSLQRVKEELRQWLQDADEVWTLKLKLQKAEAEGAASKKATEALQKENAAMLESCKQSYLAFHEETSRKLREELQQEYDGALSEMRRRLDEMATKLARAEGAYEDVLRQKEERPEGISIGDSVQLVEAKREVARLTQKVEALEAGKASPTDHSDGQDALAHLSETVEKYKRLNSDLLQEKTKLKAFYEKQVRDLTALLDLGSKELEEEVRHLKERVAGLLEATNRAQAEKERLLEGHARELRTREVRIDEIKTSYEATIDGLLASLHEAKVEVASLEEATKAQRKALERQGAKYVHLKQKFFKVRKNFDAYRAWADERAKGLAEDAAAKLKEKAARWDEEVEGIRRWLAHCRATLAGGVAGVVRELEAVPERAVPKGALETQIKGLLKVLEWVANLDLRDRGLLLLQEPP